MFASPLAIEEDDFVDGDSAGIEVEEEAIPAYDDLLACSAGLEDVLAHAAGDVFN